MVITAFFYLSALHELTNKGQNYIISFNVNISEMVAHRMKQFNKNACA